MPGLLLAPSSKPQYFNRYFSTTGFEGVVILNPRDGMIFAEIKQLSDANDSIIESELVSFRDMVQKKYGGKTITVITKDLLNSVPEERRKNVQDILNRVFVPGKGVIKYVSKEKMGPAYENACNKKHVKAQLHKFESKEYRLLSPEEVEQRYAELAEFKIKHATFVDETKVKTGQYSDFAEIEKIKNPYVRHVVIEHQGKIIACGMWVIHGNMAYGADYIVHTDYQTTDASQPKGLAQALGIKMYEDLIAAYPNIEGVTFIGGGMGNWAVGEKLFGANGFNSISIDIKDNPNGQREAGIYACFVGPGPKLLKAGNRDPGVTDIENVISSLDERKYIEKALNQVEESSRRHLAASQPVPQPVLDNLIPSSIYRSSITPAPQLTTVAQTVTRGVKPG
jgi:hypothetical protein